MRASEPVILLVDDDLNDRTLLRRAFLKAAPEMDLRMAKDAFEAEDYLTGREPYSNRLAHPLPSLILLDLKMPRRSGIEFLSWLRQQEELAEIPVIVLSSSQESSDIARSYDLGARSYLVKNVDLNELQRLARGIGTMTELLRPS